MAHVHSIIFMIIFSFSVLLNSCYGCNLQPDMRGQNLLNEEVTGHDVRAHRYGYFKSILKGMFVPRSEDNHLNRFTKVGSLAAPNKKIFNVDDFGAKGDGSDDTEAFEKAWKQACSAKGGVLLTVPQKKNYLLGPITFSGPCQDKVTVQITGNIKASDQRSEYYGTNDGRYWIQFIGVENLIVEGGGTIDGNGAIWWLNSCKINKALPCKSAPTALTFDKCNNLITRNLTIHNAQQMHVTYEQCSDVRVTNLQVTAPGNSPNTDGIHVTNTKNIQISSCVIGTGDDCISIVNGSQNVQAMDITCGPGHGISIGSLGSEDSKVYVSGVTVNGAKLFGTQNGVRIKTWQGGSGSASNIRFQNIDMQNVSNPIIIDQNYCDQIGPCKQQTSAVQVKNVMYENIKGSSASKVAVQMSCSKTFPCQGISLQDINLQTRAGSAATAACDNVNPTYTGTVSPRCP